jgi:hypothetical protein
LTITTYWENFYFSINIWILLLRWLIHRSGISILAYYWFVIVGSFKLHWLTFFNWLLILLWLLLLQLLWLLLRIIIYWCRCLNLRCIIWNKLWLCSLLILKVSSYWLYLNWFWLRIKNFGSQWCNWVRVSGISNLKIFI